MRALIGLIFALGMLSSAYAERLDGQAAEKLLDDTTVYAIPLAANGWRQSFSKGGQTTYVDSSGQKTFGQWMVRGDKYCSVWPPSDRWVCYEVESGETPDGRPTVTWISGGDGKRYEGIVVGGDHIDESSPPK
jgi:hypothetical protein